MLLPIADPLAPVAYDATRGIVSDPMGDVFEDDWRPRPGDADAWDSVGCHTDVAGADSNADMGAYALAVIGSCGSNSEVDPVPPTVVFSSC
jgi:hypothetical protein